MRYLMLSGYINIRTRFAPFDVATDYYGYIYVADGGKYPHPEVHIRWPVCD